MSARDARRAGLQAKKDEQPPNTARSYASKQREWKVRLTPHPLRGLLLSAGPPPPWLMRCLTDLVPHATRYPGRLPAQLA